MLPYSHEVYFSLFGELNTRFAGVQLFGVLLSGLLAFQLLRPAVTARWIPLAVLGVLWAGSGYFWFHCIFAEINFLAPVYAGLAGAQAVGLAIAAALPSSRDTLMRHRGVSVPFVLAALIWPVFDWVAGPGWPFVRLAGWHVAPLLFLTQASLVRWPRKTAVWLGLIPGLLAGVCAYEALVLNLTQDWLPLVGLGYVGFVLFRTKAPA